MDFETRIHSWSHSSNIAEDSYCPTDLAMNDGKFRTETSCLFLKAIIWMGIKGHISILKNILHNLGLYVVLLLPLGL